MAATGGECDFVREVADVDFPSKYGHFRIHAFENTLNNKCDIAVVKGDVRGKKNVLVRVHSECLTGDAFGSLRAVAEAEPAYIAKAAGLEPDAARAVREAASRAAAAGVEDTPSPGSAVAPRASPRPGRKPRGS